MLTIEPAYSSVHRTVPTPVITEWPAALKDYVKRVNESCPPIKKTIVEDLMRNLIKEVQSKNAIWSTDWDKMPMPNECLSYAQVAKAKKTIKQIPPIPNIAPVMPPIMPPIMPPVMPPIMPKIPPTRVNVKDAVKPPVILAIDETDDIKQSRLKRFSDKQDLENKKRKKASAYAQKVRAAYIAAGAEGNPDVIDWDEDTVVGTCTKLEKSYLRITSAVDPCLVSVRILIQRFVLCVF